MFVDLLIVKKKVLVCFSEREIQFEHFDYSMRMHVDTCPKINNDNYNDKKKTSNSSGNDDNSKHNSFHLFFFFRDKTL